MFALVLMLFGLGQLALAKTVYYEWNVTYVTAAPDGFERRVIGINGQWPCPQLDADLGDDVVVNVYNGLPDQSTTIHWHGIHQNGTSHMDGASGTNQCPIAPGQRFTYKWKVSIFFAIHNNISNNLTGRPTRYLLVSLSQCRPVP